jgi:2'-5' RNA ligase
MLPLRPGNRLFVALDLPPGLRDALADMGGNLAGGDARRIPRDNLHLTLAFLGAVAIEDGPGLRAELEAALPGPPVRVRIGRVVARPAPSRARLAAVELDDVDGELAALGARVDAAVTGLAGRASPERRFWPHVTIARFSRPTRLRRSPSTGGEHVFAITRVALYDSYIAPSRPPRYEALLDARLDGSHAERSSSHG